MTDSRNERICVIGLGYVGLPVAIAFSRKHRDIVGFDISATRISELKAGVDRTGEISEAELEAADMRFNAQRRHSPRGFP